MTKFEFEQSHKIVRIRYARDVCYGHYHHAYAGRQCGGNLEMRPSEILCHPGYSICGYEDAMVTTPLAQAVHEIRDFLTSDGVTPVFALDE